MSNQPANSLVTALGARWRAAQQLIYRLLDKVPAHKNRGKDQIVVQNSTRFIPITELQCLENFYHLEEAPDVGSWRWTGPGCSFSLFAPAERDRDQTIMIEALGTQGEVNWTNTFLEVEDEMVLCEHKMVNGRHWLTATLPMRPAAHGAFIRYHLQDCRMPPRQPDGSRDGRKLGLSLTGLHLMQH